MDPEEKSKFGSLLRACIPRVPLLAAVFEFFLSPSLPLLFMFTASSISAIPQLVPRLRIDLFFFFLSSTLLSL